jgi:hypothetical protein
VSRPLAIPAYCGEPTKREKEEEKDAVWGSTKARELIEFESFCSEELQ